METFTKDQFWAELEELGEEEVTTRLVTGRYGPKSQKRALAEMWIERRNQDRADESARRKDASQSEQIDIARSAKDAAWVAAEAALEAAKEARTANNIAAAAMIIAIIAIAASLYATVS